MSKHNKSYEFYSQVITERNLTSYRVALETKIPQSAFSQWKLYGVCPKYDKMVRIASYLSTQERPLTAADFLDLDIESEEGR